MFKILTYNNISPVGLDRLPRDKYEVASEIQRPDAIMLRSFKLHGIAIPDSVKCVGRAGAGVNNIPVAEYSQRGIPVFNAPGANSNAVKELAIAGMLLASRHICEAWDFARKLESTDDEAINQTVEKGKKNFAGTELSGKTLGVIGLGAIGVKVANAALALGMKVIGFDPSMTVDSAWQLSSTVEKALGVDDLVGRSDFISLHVPFNDHTRNLINPSRIDLLKNRAVLLNFSRSGIVDEVAVLSALEAGKLRNYVCDFPTAALLGRKGVILLPHLGASTEEAEDNCAVMVADQIRDFLENGNICNAVNFPEVVSPRADESVSRLCVANANVPNMVSQISSALGEANLNIVDLLNKSRGEYAYTMVDLSNQVPAETLERIRAINGVLSARVI
ncbi:MAG: 3-phosphoglycerate dehydrogenase [Candidatus Methylumidiphilus alinenensis]|uniref:D-3-phosphoglycerate dehydrogenase n=1 Tax=Candidatus Methylumidiphilus alinenensis TaxID=2202197 RepID=A0A2W4QT97_9GAMM|nr:MAG: 3-phosphoglycerate dehydrogenase [Candidatus Methylumidiphilus alinenensis]